MNVILENIDIDAMINALGETLFMTFVSLIFAVIIGLILGIAIYLTQEDSLYPNKPVNKVLNLIVNVLRAIPYIILLMIIVPLTTALVGSMIGAKAALPSLILSSAPFYGRMVMIALNEVDSGTIEASKAMGASNFQIITKVLIPEAKPALISSVTVMAISLPFLHATIFTYGLSWLADSKRTASFVGFKPASIAKFPLIATNAPSLFS